MVVMAKPNWPWGALGTCSQCACVAFRCRSLHALGAKATGALGSHMRVVEEHSRLMRGVLGGLYAREEALVTLLTLGDDIESKRARASELQAKGRSQRAVKVMGEVAAAEAAKHAALSEYDRVSARNREELQHFAQVRLYTVRPLNLDVVSTIWEIFGYRLR